MIGIYASDLRKGDLILGGVGKVVRPPGKPDEWGEITVIVVEDDGQRFLAKMDADAWLRIEREGEVE